MRLVTETTPTERGTYSIVGETIAACSPCCGNTAVYGKGEPTACRICEKEFAFATAAVEVAAPPSYETAAKTSRRARGVDASAEESV